MEIPQYEKQIVFIDVPGHEKFIRQMVAGVATVDCFLLLALSGVLGKIWRPLMMPTLILSIAAAIIIVLPVGKLEVWLLAGLLCASLYWSWRNMPSSLSMNLHKSMQSFSKYLVRDDKL